MLKILPTKIVESFLTDDDIEIIKNEVNEKVEFIKGNPILLEDLELLPKGTIGAGAVSRTILQILRGIHPKTFELLSDKVSKVFGKEINLANVHILTSYIPYRLHTDGIIGEHGIDENNFGAYTFLIPLDTYNSNTIVFNEYQDNSKSTRLFCERNTPKNLIDEETYKKYFSHESRDILDYLSIDKIFKWKKGSCLAMSRYVFHGSDFFFGHIPFKQGLVMWTSAPNDWNPAD